MIWTMSVLQLEAVRLSGREESRIMIALICSDGSEMIHSNWPAALANG